jgi:general secretion pathway protein J
VTGRGRFQAPADRRRVAGFTLLEVLVSLVVLGCVVLALGQGVRFGVTASNAQARMADADEEFVVVTRTLRRLITLMDPGTEDAPAVLVAGPHSLGFVSALPTATESATGSPVDVMLLMDAAQRLVLRWRPYLHATWLGPPPPMTDTELARGVRQLDLAYLRPGGGWTTTWRGRALPALVRIHLTFAPGDPRHWSDVTVAPLLDRF